jgi:hypothetical protein
MRNIFVTGLLAMSATVFAEQRVPRSAQQEATVNVAIALKAGGAAYDFTGQSVCEHAPRGSIYNTLAQRWTVRHDEPGRSLNLTLWRPMSGSADMLNLTVTIKGKTHSINTVKGPDSSSSGTANVKFEQKGDSGTFAIDGTSASGTPIRGTVKCDRFTAAEAVAGLD